MPHWLKRSPAQDRFLRQSNYFKHCCPIAIWTMLSGTTIYQLRERFQLPKRTTEGQLGILKRPEALHGHMRTFETRLICKVECRIFTFRLEMYRKRKSWPEALSRRFRPQRPARCFRLSLIPWLRC